MVTRILLLLLLCTVALRADDDIYLWVRNVDVLTNKLAQINNALGYPNPATKTERAIDFTLLTNGTNAVIRIDISAIYSPRVGRYVDWADKVKEQLTAAQWGLDVVTNVSDLQGKAVARITGDMARKAALLPGVTNITDIIK